MTSSPTQAIVLGHNLDTKKDITLSDTERTSGMYVIGGTGVGKSTLLTGVFLEDIINGHGGLFIDVDGDSINQLLPRIPQERIKDVILLDPGADDRYVGINPLAGVKSNRDSDRVIQIFKRLWNIGPETPNLENTLRACLLTLWYNQKTIAEMPYLLRDKEFREACIANFPSSVSGDWVRWYWEQDFGRWYKHIQLERSDSTLNKILQLLMIENTAYVVSQNRTTLDFRKLMDENKIVLLRLSLKDVGEDAVRFLGTILMAELKNALLSRADSEDRSFFSVCADEWQLYLTPDFKDMLTRGRKYGLGATIANQTLSQLREVDRELEGITQQVNIHVTFRVGADDADTLAPYYAKDPPPAETRKEPVLEINPNPVEWFKNHRHRNERVNELVDKYVRPLLEKSLELNRRSVPLTPDITQLLLIINEFLTHAMYGVTRYSVNATKTLDATEMGLQCSRVAELIANLKRPERVPEISERIKELKGIVSILCSVILDFDSSKWGDFYKSLLPPPEPVKEERPDYIHLDDNMVSRIDFVLMILKNVNEESLCRAFESHFRCEFWDLIKGYHTYWSEQASAGGTRDSSAPLVYPPERITFPAEKRLLAYEQDNSRQRDTTLINVQQNAAVLREELRHLLQPMREVESRLVMEYERNAILRSDLEKQQNTLLEATRNEKQRQKIRDEFTHKIHVFNENQPAAYAAITNRNILIPIYTRIVSWICTKLEALRISLAQDWQEREKQVNDERQAYETTKRNLEEKLRDLQEKLGELDTQRSLEQIKQVPELEQKERLLHLVCTRFRPQHSSDLGLVSGWSTYWVNGFLPSNTDYYDREHLDDYIDAYQGNGVFLPAALTTLRGVSIYGCNYTSKRFGSDRWVFRTGYLGNVYNSFPETQLEKEAQEEIEAIYERRRNQIEKELNDIAEEIQSWKVASEEYRKIYMQTGKRIPPEYAGTSPWWEPHRKSWEAKLWEDDRNAIIRKLYYDHYRTSTDPIWQKRREEAEKLAEQEVQAVVCFISEWDELAQLLFADPIMIASGQYEEKELTRRTHADMEKEAAKELVNLPNRKAYLAVGSRGERFKPYMKTKPLPYLKEDSEERLLQEHREQALENAKQYTTEAARIEQEIQERRRRQSTTPPPVTTVTEEERTGPAGAARIAKRRAATFTPIAVSHKPSPQGYKLEDRDILYALYQFRHLTIDQLARTLQRESSLNRVREIINERLVSQGLVSSTSPGGRAAYVYTLTKKGKKALEAEKGTLPEMADTGYSAHLHNVNNLLIPALLLPNVEPRIRLLEWQHAEAFKVTPIAIGNNRTVVPDGFVSYVLSPPFGKEGEPVGIIFEWDEATESLAQLRDKFLRYIAFASGIYQDTFHLDSLTIAFCASEKVRILRMKTLAEEVTKDRKANAEQFLFAGVSAGETDPLTLCTTPLFHQPFDINLHALIELGA